MMGVHRDRRDIGDRGRTHPSLNNGARTAHCLGARLEDVAPRGRPRREPGREGPEDENRRTKSAPKEKWRKLFWCARRRAPPRAAPVRNGYESHSRKQNSKRKLKGQATMGPDGSTRSYNIDIGLKD